LRNPHTALFCFLLGIDACVDLDRQIIIYLILEYIINMSTQTQIFKSGYLSDRYGFDVWVDNETQNITGSHKDRSFSVWIKKISQQDVNGLVISSSGNAAVSAAYFACQYRLPLAIFVSVNINQEKLDRIRKIAANNRLVSIYKVEKPKFSAVKYAKENNFILLRASTSDDALLGYKSLAQDIENSLTELGSIFIPSSSGTLAVGICSYLNFKPQFHIVQTAKVNTLVKNFDQNYKPEKVSLADAIVDLIGHRRFQIEKIIKDSCGWGWTIEDKDLKESIQVLNKAGIRCSATSALSLAGLEKCVRERFGLNKPALLIIT